MIKKDASLSYINNA